MENRDWLRQSSPEAGNVGTAKDAEEQVRAMARLFGLMFYHFANLLVERFGEAEGRRLVMEAVKRFGLERGERMKKKAVETGLKPVLVNLSNVNDLPRVGWGGSGREAYCPFAEVWIEKRAEELCKPYCAVDIWKMEGYNPRIKVKRLRWVLDGDRDCNYQMNQL